MMKLIALCVVALTSVFAANGWAQTVTNEAAALQTTLPEGWVQATDGGVLVAHDPAEEIGVLFVVTPAESVEAAAAALNATLDPHLDDVVVTAPGEAVEVNGMPGIAAGGSATMEGTPVNWMVAVFCNNGHALFTIAIADEATLAAHAEEIQAIMGSTRPL